MNIPSYSPILSFLTIFLVHAIISCNFFLYSISYPFFQCIEEKKKNMCQLVEEIVAIVCAVGLDKVKMIQS